VSTLNKQTKQKRITKNLQKKGNNKPKGKTEGNNRKRGRKWRSTCVQKKKDIWGSGDVAPRILNIGTIRRLMVSLAPLSFYSFPTKKKPSYANQWIGGLRALVQVRSERFREEVCPCLKSRHAFLGHLAHSVVIISTETSWLPEEERR
jgi:hypothetical protein